MQGNTTLMDEPSMEHCRGCQGLEHCKQSPKGFIPVEVDALGGRYEMLRMCRYEKQERQQSKIARLFTEAQVPKMFKSDTWASYEITGDNREAVAKAKVLVKNGGSLGGNGKGLLLYGDRGCGKTKLAAIIANDLTKAGQAVLFSTVPELLDNIRESYGSSGKSTQEVTREVKTAEVLIMDDLGTERMTTWTSEQLYLIINTRYTKALPTIITTNYAPKELLKRLAIVDKAGKLVDPVPAERLISRINAMCEFVRIGGGDRRAWEPNIKTPRQIAQ